MFPCALCFVFVCVCVHLCGFTDLNLYCIKGALVLFVCFSFFYWLHVCVLGKAEYSAFESTLNSTIVSYRIVVVSATGLSVQRNTFFVYFPRCSYVTGVL